MMMRGRILSSALRLSSGSSWKVAGPQQPWIVQNTRAMSSLKLPSSSRTNGNGQTDINLIARRFFHQRKSGNEESGGSFKSKMFGAIGTILGIGSWAVYNAVVDQNSIFKGYSVAHCADKGKCENACKDKKCEDSPCLRKSECEEEKISKANADLEKALKDTKGKAIEYTEAAMKAYCAAIEVMQEYLNQGYCIIDNDEMESPIYEETWCCLYELSKKRYEKVKEALQKGQCAWELLCRLRELIQCGRACKFTACNPLLKTAEESLLCAEKELLTLKGKMDCLSSEHDMVDQYREVIEPFRQDLKCDLDSLPDSEKCPIQFCEQETALIINMAYQKVIRVQKEMAQVLICKGTVPEKQKQTSC